MNAGKLGWLGLSVLVLGCASKPLGECGGETCTAYQVCDQATLRCVSAPAVTDAPPAVTVFAPTTLVTNATFVVTGKITDDLAVTAAEWRVGTGALRPIALAADGAFSITIDAPMLDSQSVVVTVKARDARAETSVEKTGTPVTNPRSGVEALAELTIPTTFTGDVFDFEVIATDPGGNQTRASSSRST